MNKKKILIDVDEVICDSGFLKLMNEFLGTNYKLEDFTEYYIDDVIGDDNKKQEFYNYFVSKDAYADAIVFDNAHNTLKSLNDKYEIYIYSSCVNPFFVDKAGGEFKKKYDFLIRTFPFLNPYNFIFTGTKNMFKADVQIDDRLNNLKGDIGLKLLYTAYHNKNIGDEELKSNNVIRVNNWKEIEKILL